MARVEHQSFDFGMHVANHAWALVACANAAILASSSSDGAICQQSTARKVGCAFDSMRKELCKNLGSILRRKCELVLSAADSIV